MAYRYLSLSTLYFSEMYDTFCIKLAGLVVSWVGGGLVGGRLRCQMRANLEVIRGRFCLKVQAGAVYSRFRCATIEKPWSTTR